VSATINVFIDGLIGFFFARKHRNNREKWITLGVDATQSMRNWRSNSKWNFSNKLCLLEAELFFTKDNDRAISKYKDSIEFARKHQFVHEEGLAEEKTAAYFLHKKRHDEAMAHFINAKKCYEIWGAHTLVKHIDVVIAKVLPLCIGKYRDCSLRQ